MQLSGVTEWLVSNIATRVLIHTDKFWTANKTDAIMHFRLSESSEIDEVRNETQGGDWPLDVTCVTSYFGVKAHNRSDTSVTLGFM